MSVLQAIGKGLLSLVPGGNLITAGIELAGDIAGAVGGETGQKIKQGADMLAEGLESAGRQPLSPEQQAQLQEAGLRHQERMLELEVVDAQGGRELARQEVASRDTMVSRTRPLLLRVYGFSAVLLVFFCVIVGTWAAFENKVNGEQGQFLLYLFGWATSAILGTFYFMFQVYTGKRTKEKMVEAGMMPEGLIDKLIRIKSGKGA